MTITIEHEYNLDMGFDLNKVVNTIVEASLDYLDCPYEAEVNVTFVDNASIHEINLEQREIDRPTDVLSFPMLEFNKAGDFSNVEEDLSNFNPDTGELMLGDIVISLDKVSEQAREFNHSPKRELAFLVAHSMLHLSGYDHIDDEERKVMEEMQEKILESKGYTRDII